MWPIILLYWELLVPPLYLYTLASTLLMIILFWTSLTPFIKKYFFLSFYSRSSVNSHFLLGGGIFSDLLWTKKPDNKASQNYIYWILRKRLRGSPKNKTHGFLSLFVVLVFLALSSCQIKDSQINEIPLCIFYHCSETGSLKSFLQNLYC